MHNRRLLILILLGMLLLTGCHFSVPAFVFQATPTPQPTSTRHPTATPTVIPSPTITPSPTVTPSPTITLVPLRPTPTLMPLTGEQRADLFNQLWTRVRDNYVYTDYGGVDWEGVRAEFAPRVVTATTEAEFYGLLREMIERLGDEHSRFESPQDVAAETARFNGNLNYGGIGALVRTVEEGGLIIQVTKGGPAATAGIEPRDLILAVEGIPFIDTAAFGPHGPIGAVRGTPGTTVMLTVRSPGSLPRTVPVMRRAIQTDAFIEVEAQILPGTRVGLLRLDTFNSENLVERVRTRLVQLTTEMPLEGLIVDVRTNSGGRVDMLLNILALFNHGGLIGSQSGQNFRADLTVPTGAALPQLAGVPIVVLTGPETVSAAEMFAVGMQVLGRARIVGLPSAGNTENLRGHDLYDGSRLWLAELTYRLPDGRLIEEIGVQPDRVVDADWWQFEPAQDPQIQAALEEVRRMQDATEQTGAH